MEQVTRLTVFQREPQKHKARGRETQRVVSKNLWSSIQRELSRA